MSQFQYAIIISISSVDEDTLGNVYIALGEIEEKLLMEDLHELAKYFGDVMNDILRILVTPIKLQFLER